MRSPSAGGKKRGVLIWWGSWSCASSYTTASTASGSGSPSARSFTRTLQAAPGAWPGLAAANRIELPSHAAVLEERCVVPEARTPVPKKVVKRPLQRKRRTISGSTRPAISKGVDDCAFPFLQASHLDPAGREVKPCFEQPSPKTAQRRKVPSFTTYSLLRGIRSQKYQPSSSAAEFEPFLSYARVIARPSTTVKESRVAVLLPTLRRLYKER